MDASSNASGEMPLSPPILIAWPPSAERVGQVDALLAHALRELHLRLAHLVIAGRATGGGRLLVRAARGEAERGRGEQRGAKGSKGHRAPFGSDADHGAAPG